jgi:mannosyltransferase OCH1-like enzyme
MIPKIIWQTHSPSYNKLPKYITECSETWKSINPDFQYNYLNDEDVDSFILKYFGKEWLDLLNKCPVKIMKIDTWKYMITYVYGGVYADIDYVCKSPINLWSDKERDLIIFQDDIFLEFTQSVFASKPENIILKETLDLIKNDLKKVITYGEVDFVGRFTGYRQFSSAIDNVLNLKNKNHNGIIKTYDDFNNNNEIENMKIYTPYFKNWDRFNINNPLFYSVHGRINWENNYGNWLKDQHQILMQYFKESKNKK